MGLASIWSRDNLQLAWRRITTGRNFGYKRFFRRLYYAYEIALADNLKDLQTRLKGGSFRPQTPTRAYMPKPSGLQRPVTLLCIEDQIVLQAIANVFADKVLRRRRKLEHKSIFSNIVQRPPGSIFFLQDWRISYSLFQERIEEYFKGGFRWIAHFDLAAYYDTICHDMLLRTAFPRSRDGNRDSIPAFLKTWSAESSVCCHEHGIPQGPIASDFLAECFLLPVDEALQRHRFKYVRYVDDIRLFGKSENQVRLAAIRMEILLRERGLIPQGEKHAITHAKSLDEAMGILPSIQPRTDGADPAEDPLSTREAVTKFRAALSGRPLAITDKTRARYVLFRAGPSGELRDYVLRLMPRHPEHVDAMVHYLTRCKPSRAIVQACTVMMKASPYEYVKGEMWHLLAKMMQPSDMKPIIPLAVDAAKDRRACLAWKWGALHFLCVAEKAGLGKYARFLMHQENTLLQALLAPILPDARYAKGDVAEAMLKRSAFEPGIALTEQLVRLKITPAQLGVNTNSLPSQVRNTLRTLGLVSRRSPRVDPMGEVLCKRYSVQQWDGWKGLCGVEYSHGLQLLKIADTSYDIGRSQWLSYQNSFNHYLFLAFQKWLHAKGLAGVVKTVDKNGKAVKYGILVDAKQPFARVYPDIASAFAAANTRRNSLPGSHPYDQAAGQRTRHLGKREQGDLATQLSRAYEEFISIGTRTL